MLDGPAELKAALQCCTQHEKAVQVQTLTLVVRMLPMKDVASGYLLEFAHSLSQMLPQTVLHILKPDPEALLDHRVQFCIRRNARQDCSVSAPKAQQ